MTKLEELYQCAADAKIRIVPKAFMGHVATSVRYRGQTAIFLDMDALKTEAAQVKALAHELAHITEDSMAGDSAPHMLNGKLEHRAWVRAIGELVPEERLEAAMADCGGRLWEVSEELGVPESLVRRAVRYYATKEG